MPKYTFRCENGHSDQKTVSSKTKSIPCSVESCQSTMERQMPILNGQSNVTEVVDKYMGIVWKEGQRELVKERHDEYYWSVEVPRLVNSGTYSLETMLQNGWVWIDDNEHIHTHTKPLHKR